MEQGDKTGTVIQPVVLRALFVVKPGESVKG
jgi:hypothetical protein